MAAANKTKAKKIAVAGWKITWKDLFLAASVTVNIGFIVVVITTMTSNVLDGFFITQGLTRYCLSENSDKFAGSTDQVQALREYTCANGEAKQFFNDGFQKYLDFIKKPS